jgi:hypothetical protein
LLVAALDHQAYALMSKQQPLRKTILFIRAVIECAIIRVRIYLFLRYRYRA